MYQVLLYIHIVSAIIWVGGAFYAQLLAVRATRSADPGELPRLARTIEWFGSRVFMPAAVALFVAGAGMTLQAWSFGQAWIAISVALWIASSISGAAYLAPRARRMAALFDTEGPTSPDGLSLLARMFLVVRLELASFALIVALMVFKPGS